MAAKQRQPKFEIDASVVYELGEKLISDEVQALVELTKNSYDADASYVNVTVESKKSAGDNSLNFSQSKGYIIIEDDGMGMDWEDIKRGWLTISDSPKRRMKAKGKTTKRGRTPLGEKGLGRLGSQRLGRKIEMWTSKTGSKIETYAGIDWGDFKNQVLSKVPIYFNEDEKETPRKGTKVVISDLRSPDNWLRNARNDLVGKLAQMLFPFEELRPFDIFLSIDGRRIDLDRISQSIFDVADAQFQFTFDGEKLHIQGMYRLSFFLATVAGEHIRQQFQRLMEVDQGADFYVYLNENRKAIPGLKWKDGLKWFVSFEQEYVLEDLGESNLIDSLPLSDFDSEQQSEKEIANPGPFHGVIYSFTRKGTDLSTVSDIFNVQAEFSKYIGRHSGVRVYRNGFGIRPFGLGTNDWLQFRSGQTSGASWYGLRPKNVIGSEKRKYF